MATALVDLSNPAQRKAEAQKHFNIICKSAVPVSVNSLRIGYHAAIMKRDSLFGILGFETDRQAQEASGVKESTWHNVIRIAQAYDGVEEELFVAMKLSNAEAAIDLPDSKRKGKKWLTLAATTPIEKFKEMVEEELDGKAKASDGRERVVSISIKMPKSRKKAVEAGLLEFSKSAGCEGDESRALELLVAEKSGSPSLVGVITSAVQKLKSIKELCEQSIMSSDEILAKVLVMNEEMILDFAAALDGIQNLEPGE